MSLSSSFRFEATKKIRDIESEVNSWIERGELIPVASGPVLKWHVPILAMTADVIQATNEKCLKSQMDGYVSKPFDAQQLFHEVSRFFEAGLDHSI